MSAAAPALPEGFRVRVRRDVRRLDGGRVLVGGSPLRVIRLGAPAQRLVGAGELRVGDRTSARLAERLLRANVADPVLDHHDVDPADLTVVVPIRDRAPQLDRCLSRLGGRLHVLVVDDASHDPAAVRAVALRHGAHLVALPANGGPAVARNAGLRHVRTAYVAFVDSDVQVDTATLLRLARHLSDPRVALAGPLVGSRALAEQPRWFERFDQRSSSLALGEVACEVRPGAAVAWLPSACLVGRVADLGDGFSSDMRVGEDVDLVWRLVAAGRTVRYDPTERADHDTRTTVRDWLGRKYLYGTGGAPLAARHGSHTAVAVLSPAMAVAGAAVLLRRRWSLPVVAAATWRAARVVERNLPDDLPGRRAEAARLALRGLGWSVRQQSALALRHWLPPVLAACLVSRTARRMVATALVVDTLQALPEAPPSELPATLLGRRLDDAAYGAGLWSGVFRARSLACVGVRVLRRR